MKQQVLEIILNRPNARTVEIADKLDIDPEQVRPFIAAEIAQGVIVEETIVAPNGRPVMSFRYASAAPKATVINELPSDPLPPRVLRALPPTERPLAAAPRPQVPAPEPIRGVALDAPAPLEIDVPVTRKADVPLAAPSIVVQPKQTRVERAIACLRAANGTPVHSADLADAMGLKDTSSPAAYLKYAMSDGRVCMRGKNWTLGPALGGTPEAVPASQAPQAPTAAQWVASAEGEDSPAIERPPVAPVSEGVAAASAWVAAAEDDAPLRIGGAANYPIPPVAEGAPDISRPGLYENGEFRKAPEEIVGVAPVAPAVPVRDSGAQRFIAGVLSDGSLHLRIPGISPLDLPPEHARALYEFMQAHGYAAWPKQPA